ncbi:MAG TPA: NapC/NirT family cytochrome c [Rhodocyclaceae bacterium]|nr:NapC/NirT family cytochrome c [Rhodocyclaceae bacterium]
MSEDKSKGIRGRLRAAGFGGIVIVFAAGIIFWGGFNWAVEATNTERFCLSCHEMENFVYQEYRNTIHYQNRTGVRAVCSDCHVPNEWGPKMIRKVQASRELWGKLTGSIDTPEKFKANRLRLAEREWKRMKANDSRECRNCHSFEYFDYTAQGRRSNHAHQTGLAEGKTCIDCHKGIAHSLPPIEQDIGIGRDGAVPQEAFRPE